MATPLIGRVLPVVDSGERVGVQKREAAIATITRRPPTGD